MKRLLHQLNKNVLLKLAGFNSIHVFIKIGTGAIMSWILANFVGAAGMGILGNLRNFMQGLLSFSVLGLENGLVKNTAQFQEDSTALKRTYNTSWVLSFSASIIAAVAIFIFAPWLDEQLIATDVDFSLAFKLIAVSLPFYVVFVFVTSMMQGLEWYKKFITLNIVVSLLVFCFSAYLAFQYNLEGALYALAIVPFLQCFVAVFYWSLQKNVTIRLKELLQFNFDKKTSKQLLKYSVMALVSALLIPLVNILVRDQVRVEVSDEAAGLWEAVVRISGHYMLFVTSLISLYVLPSLSKDASTSNYKKTIMAFYKNILPLVFLGLLGVYLFRDFIIAVLFSEEFEPASALFKWQLLGDFIKVITTVMAFRFIALNDLKRYLIAEVLSILSFYLLALVFIKQYQEEGVVIAYLGNYIFYFLLLLIILRKELFKREVVD
ncbi:PST family polysaccharide transporter [Nonlabens dokdonensis]|jgi:PST family polysaccharide transporter|uniref:LPS biosynthesis protein n=2 Tax=Nonlabens dokdonensis TaxID=328515 RepID=L7WC31_NONDD|nr:O-antigen translocase [Nonlabens dokdonensis]AGC77476.1 LPS biosynthesis protein [Nonlabens dokdonensis DSW-6]PZX39963.1 PST family polysaccharide transporter [Nonlabens dokdonensis]